jgi:threonine synthase
LGLATLERASRPRPTLLERYRAFLPVDEGTPALSLGEGTTPLVPARRLGASIGLPNLHLKVEGMNPTGSFKDRGMVLAVAKALEAGARDVVCASTGNTAASAAAYAAAAGLRATVVLPAGNVAVGKLAQAIALGARVLAIAGSFDDALAAVREIAGAPNAPAVLVNSVNPDRIAGQTTGAFEVCDELGRAPDVLAIPVGNGGNITAYWAGFRAYEAAGQISALPRMLGFQAAGAAPLVLGHRVERPETVATAIRIGDPASATSALAARDESGGAIDSVSDDEILAAYRAVATLEGVFCEPASAASIAGVTKLAADGRLDRDAVVVAVLTGTGLKDPDAASRGAVSAVIEIEATTDAIRAAVGW